MIWEHRQETMGVKQHPLYPTWNGMMQRCVWKCNNTAALRLYGARGITVCEEWHRSRNFLNWIDEHLGPRPEGYTLDRIDPNGNYEPGNVAWASAEAQAANRRSHGAKRAT